MVAGSEKRLCFKVSLQLFNIAGRVLFPGPECYCSNILTQLYFSVFDGRTHRVIFQTIGAESHYVIHDIDKFIHVVIVAVSDEYFILAPDIMHNHIAVVAVNGTLQFGLTYLERVGDYIVRFRSGNIVLKDIEPFEIVDGGLLFLHCCQTALFHFVQIDGRQVPDIVFGFYCCT